MFFRNRSRPWPSVLSVGLLLLATGAVANEPDDGLGKADAQPNRITGQVVLADGLPASHAKVHVHMPVPSGIDATITTDADGRFDFVVRMLPTVLVQLQFTATSQDEQQLAFYRLTREQSERVAEGIEIQLEPQRTVEVEVVDQQLAAVEDAQVALQLGWPNVLTGFATDESGKVSFSVPASERIESVVAWKDNLGLDYRLYSIPRDQLSDVKAVPPEFPLDRPERLMLEGARPVTVQVTDTAGEPIEGVSLYPWLLKKPQAPEELNFSYFLAAFSQRTDAQGDTTFAWLPSWQEQGITFWPQAEGFDRIRINYDPASNEKLVVTLNRLVPIRGQVAGADGKPAADIQIRAMGKGHSFNDFWMNTRSDAEGRYEIAVAPNQVYLLTVLDEKWVANPQTGFAVFPDKPLDNRNFQLRTPTRVHGRLLNERTQEPIPNESVTVYQYGTALQEMPEVELPNPDNERHYVQPMAPYIAKTNELGQFEFLLGDGQFDIRPPQQGQADRFSVAGQPDIEMDVTTKIQAEVELVGIVIDRETSQPIAGATVSGVPRSLVGRDWQATTGEDGKFIVRRREEETYAHAVNAERSQAAIIEIGDTKKTFVIQLDPVGVARGRLLNDAKEPVVGQKLDYGVKVPSIELNIWSYRFGGLAVTDELGNFELPALVAGWEYVVSLPPTPEGSLPQLTKVTVESGEQKELGDLAMPAPHKPYQPPTLEDRIQSAFEVTGTPLERYQRSLETIKLVNQHLLIVFGQPDDARIASLMKLRFEDPEFRPYTDEFRFMAIPTDAPRLDAALALAEPLEEELPQAQQPFQLVICDASGKKVASAGIEQLCAEGDFSKDKFFELLRQHLTQPLDARELLDDALRRAKEEDKRVIVQETATWCGPCHMLSRLLDANRVWEQDYIWVKMDHRWTGAKEVMAEIRDGAEGGIPWFAILDASGKKLATSNAPESGDNIGYPSEESGQVHFAHILNTTRQRMTEADVQSLIDAIDKAK